MSWAEAELKTMELGDERRNRRVVEVMGQLGERPSASVPKASGKWADTIAAYRLFGNEAVDWREIHEAHVDSAVERMAEHEVVLCIQDTTELDFNGRQIEGLGRLNYEARRGMYVHPTYAVSTQRVPLGVLDAWMWARQPKTGQGKRAGVRESLRWVEGYQRLAELAPQLPGTRLVYVADRESDIMELMAVARDCGTPVDWLLRSQHNRALAEGDKLWDSVMRGQPLGEVRFTLPARPGRRAREVVQQVWAGQVQLPDGAGSYVQASCIVAREVDPPADLETLEWRLVTNRDVNDMQQAAQMIDWYRARWEIEMYFHVLKNGCRVEALQLRSIEKIERALVLYMVVAWRIAALMRLGRSGPDMDAQVMFEPDEWKAAYILNKLPPPQSPPKLNDVVRLVARLGGFLARKGDGEPGVKTIWEGMQRIFDAVIAMEYSRQLQAVGRCV